MVIEMEAVLNSKEEDCEPSFGIDNIEEWQTFVEGCRQLENIGRYELSSRKCAQMTSVAKIFI
jgi:hypothetical protein